MALEARLAVTQPYYGPDGGLVYDVGHEFPLNEELPDGVHTRVTVAEVPDPEPAKAEPVKAEPAAKPKAPAAADRDRG